MLLVKNKEQINEIIRIIFFLLGEKILKFFVGDKSKNDLKLINPIIDKIHSFHQEVSDYSNDELRAETINFKTKIHDATSNLHNEIDKIKSEIENQTDIIKKESLF